eukprot:CAMPEP_0184317126 /NCGR_PEP_ID=MMETSP1049-20130417/94666_1 /TAXON_ID=77928 /ORGANISM="Proteomonas sulcata, Strain CCMP704" /LENGTH=141 /DNA_ID=CAMNT_0026636389 /DNA_START=329 /DNA_END=754 /DNA_ORIENTATION=+
MVGLGYTCNSLTRQILPCPSVFRAVGLPQESGVLAPRAFGHGWVIGTLEAIFQGFEHFPVTGADLATKIWVGVGSHWNATSLGAVFVSLTHRVQFSRPAFHKVLSSLDAEVMLCADRVQHVGRGARKIVKIAGSAVSPWPH